MALIRVEDLLEPYLVIPASLLLILLVFVGYLVYSGLFATIDISTQEPVHGEMTVCYKVGRGPYKNTGELFQECAKLLPGCLKIGIYYDDPESVPEDLLRFAVGVIVAKNEEIPDADEVRTLMSAGYKIAHFPRPNYCVMVNFPFKTMLSIYIAIFRVYPKLKDYIFSKGLCAYPAIEIYSTQLIEFMMPLSRQEEFFVPEFSDELISNATTEMSSHAENEAGGHEEVDEPRAERQTRSSRKNVERREDPENNDEVEEQVIKEVGDVDENQEKNSKPEKVRKSKRASRTPIVDNSEEEEEASSTSSFEDLAPEVEGE